MQFYPLKVISLEEETPLAKSISFAKPKAFSVQFNFVPGQYLTLAHPKDPKIRRCYSICSATNQEFLTIGVKKVEGGLMSSFLVNELKVGDIIEVSPPTGNFKLYASPLNAKRYCFIAGGSGVTPIKSMIESLIKNEPNSDVTLLYGNRDISNIIFKEYFERLALYPNVKCLHILENLGEELHDAIKGRLTYETCYDLIQENTDIRRTEYYMCGPAIVMENASKALLSLRVPENRIFKEYFTVNPKTEPEDLKEQTIQLITNTGNKSIPVAKGQSVLTACADAGIELPYSCKLGICSSCKQKLIKGSVKHSSDSGLTTKDKKQGYILTCQAYPTDDRVLIDVRKVSVGTRKSFNRKVAVLAGFIIALILMGAFTFPEQKKFLALGKMNTGHEQLKCSDCHADAKGNFTQQLKANVQFAFGQRKNPVTFGSYDVDNKKCENCHNRPNDRHPVHRFDEPRFADARRNIGANNCENCHGEHNDTRISIENLGFCVNCHQDTELSEDPIDIPHKTLIAQENWNTCLQCHDFHGNHIMETAHKMRDTISIKDILNYAKGGLDPYGTEKEYLADQAIEDIKNLIK